jgi:hypothetical protein
MTSNTNAKPLGAETNFIKGDFDNMVMLGNPLVDSMLQMMIALGAEVWSGQQRVKVMEKLLTTRGKVTTEMIESYVPTPEETAAWAAERKAMVDRIYSVLAQNTADGRSFDSTHPNLDRG